ncbi:MAG: outer membrane beta-barrel protein [Fusobacterium gastrosuis]|uniref:outer membrane beta-barrel protein n=1 Tax=Fusobacterium gastrosuis TaxID=1755100 RepID=UPI002A84584E|nr:outer membrane beta-barrel protein [Fusobacterium gastrosuis]
MKKLLLAIFALTTISSFAEGNFNLYTKVGVDLSSKFSKFIDDPIPLKAKHAYSFFLEGTKNITPNLEIGTGLGYIARKGKDYSFIDDGTRIHGELPTYNSIPLYLTTKFNFETGNELKPFIKADLGYSFNKLKNKTEYEDGKAVVYDNINSFDFSKATNGLYAGIGIGTEYKNFVIDLSYTLTKSKIKWTDGSSEKYNNKAIRLSVGYKFNF